jgi:hypothetical protein
MQVQSSLPSLLVEIITMVILFVIATTILSWGVVWWSSLCHCICKILAADKLNTEKIVIRKHSSYRIKSVGLEKTAPAWSPAVLDGAPLSSSFLTWLLKANTAGIPLTLGVWVSWVFISWVKLHLLTYTMAVEPQWHKLWVSCCHNGPFLRTGDTAGQGTSARHRMHKGLTLVSDSGYPGLLSNLHVQCFLTFR